MKPLKLPEQSYLLSIFDYDPLSGNLVRKINTRGARKGDIAGNLRKNGYIRVEINGKPYYSHRVIWVLHYGAIPDGMQIDHINGIRNDNTLSNLRLVKGASENHQNRKMSVTNTTGFVGVFKEKATKNWRARIRVKGKRISLGSFPTPEEASAAYKEAKRKYHTVNPVDR